MDRILNFESLLVRLGNDGKLVNEILLLFLDTIPEQMGTLRSAIEEKNYELIQHISHSLKGSAGNISAEKLAGTAGLLETAVKENNIRISESLFLLLSEEYEELEKIIRQLLNHS